MMPELLSIPFKRALSIDFKKELTTLIESSSLQEASCFKDDIDKLADARNKIMDIDVSEDDLKILQKYYSYLQQLNKKFPNDQIKYTWFQTLTQKSYSCSLYSTRFEELNIIYNIGCMFSLLACKYNDNSSEGTKKACIYFQKSAGYFEYLKKHINDTEECVVDLNSIEAIVSILLASAQELTWFKSIQDNYQDSLICKLAKKTSEFYTNALIYSKKSELIRGDWVEFIENKQNYFLAVAYYRYACSIIPKKQMGVAIKSLVMAKHFLEACSSKYDSTIMINRKPFDLKIATLLKDTERDNDFIYLQPIPDSIEELQSASMVKSIEIGEKDLIGDEGNDVIFKDLIPLVILNLASAYNERQDEYITNQLIKPIEALSNILEQKMTEFSNEDASTSTKDEFVNIDANELGLIQEKLIASSSKNATIASTLRETRSSLDNEAKKNEQLLKRYGTISWTLEDSTTVNGKYYDVLQKLEAYLHEGCYIDKETNDAFAVIDKGLLTNPLKQLNEIEVKNKESNPLRSKILNIIFEREDIVKQIKNASFSQRILPKIVDAYKKSNGDLETAGFEDEFQMHLKVFDGFKKQINKMKVENHELEEELKRSTVRDNEMTKSLNATTTGPRRISPLELLTVDWKESYQLFQQVRHNVEEGETFYADLCEKTNELSQEVKQFVEHREVAQRKLIDEIGK
ncbi:hypothetical protein TPHA_0G01420 [Tetrapisispora phaffii CBS 4417]|uniref:BRO1 domain-containing protein n=1 Tax=Tetrapisispora phaffii (strain ATCC 24235 / CBS 4417 / NBRC 1672 / NRRL Y-8282 / UCD 70-5) TaxID=1071381 RepID=G8BVQ1_TETPH|nr:hypothetical protein TPHA_0G01420 [Tetrapisispora phaffii CBS 4417]CCE63979.1 hypothetical protein TPHA_0G01420 [Tetrapisispora phaffii CBS 4417]